MDVTREFRQHLPGFLARFRGRCLSDVRILAAWAFEVEGWGYRSWLRQQNYERLYNKHYNPTSFLNGLEYLLALLEPYLFSETTAAVLFEKVKDVDLLTAIVREQAGEKIERASDPPLDIEKTRLSTCQGVRCLRGWIAQRRQPVHLQLLEVLRTIEFVESDELDKWGLPQLTVPLLSEKDWQEYLTMLLQQFEYAPRPGEGELGLLLSKLRGLIGLPLDRVHNHKQESQLGKFYLQNLTEQYPDWRFPGLDDRHVIHAHSLPPQLWQELVWAFIQRMKGAWRFYNDVAALLGKDSVPYPFSAALTAPPLPAILASAATTGVNSITELDISVYLADKCSIDLCNKAAKKVGLYVGKRPDTYADLRIHALATALKETGSLQIASIGIINFRPVLAERYGVSNYNLKYRPQHGKGTGPSQRIETWDNAYNSAHLFLKNHYEQERRKK